jgi:predicted DNA-binding transcriptional regulator YafY
MMTTKRRDGSLSKTARLMYLKSLQEAGQLSHISKNALARRLGVSRFTIYRDIDDLGQLQIIYKELIKKVEKS